MYGQSWAAFNGKTAKIFARTRSICRVKELAGELSFDENEMRSEYDSTGGVRGKHHKMMQEGYSVSVHRENGEVDTHDFMTKKYDTIILKPDISPYFPDFESVNRALRCLIPLLPKRA